MEYHNKGILIFSVMKFVLVGPGIMTIPPPGWGAVEILLWDYFQELTRQGHDVSIVNKLRKDSYDQQPNTLYSQELIHEINTYQADVVHIHYDCLHYIIPFLKCSCICITSHYPYIGNTSQYGEYHDIFHSICQNNTHFICAISNKDYEIFKTYAVYPDKVYYTPNGSSPIEPLHRRGLHRHKSIYVGKIEPRKKQHFYKCLPYIDFYGKCDDPSFQMLPCYKGEKEHCELMELMREYGNLLLLSDGESDPLVLKEALMAGLPIVTNHRIMPDLPFIDIIPEDKLRDMHYIQTILEKSKKKDRTGIREYASQFSWENVVRNYVSFFNVKMNIIPIGPNCKVAQTLNLMKIRQASYPWDWIRDTSVRDVIDVLKQENFDVLTWNKFQTMDYSMPHDYKGDTHNLDELLFEGGDLLSKYKRRFKRLFEKVHDKSTPCYFLRFGDGNDLDELQELFPHCKIIHIPDGHPDSTETYQHIYEITNFKKDPYNNIIREIVVQIIEKNEFPISSEEIIERLKDVDIENKLRQVFTESMYFNKSELLSFLFSKIKNITGIEYPLH